MSTPACFMAVTCGPTPFGSPKSRFDAVYTLFAPPISLPYFSIVLAPGLGTLLRVLADAVAELGDLLALGELHRPGGRAGRAVDAHGLTVAEDLGVAGGLRRVDHPHVGGDAGLGEVAPARRRAGRR